MHCQKAGNGYGLSGILHAHLNDNRALFCTLQSEYVRKNGSTTHGNQDENGDAKSEGRKLAHDGLFVLEKEHRGKENEGGR